MKINNEIIKTIVILLALVLFFYLIKIYYFNIISIIKYFMNFYKFLFDLIKNGFGK